MFGHEDPSNHAEVVLFPRGNKRFGEPTAHALPGEEGLPAEAGKREAMALAGNIPALAAFAVWLVKAFRLHCVSPADWGACPVASTHGRSANMLLARP